MLRPPSTRPGRRLWRVLACLVAATGGCIGFAYHPSDTPLPEACQRLGMRRFEIHAGRYMGISDLAAATAEDPDPALWMVPERQRALLRLAPPPAAPQKNVATASETLSTQLAVHTLTGVPAATDTESLALLGPELVALGTETPWPQREADDVLLARLEGRGAKVVQRLRFSYAPFGLKGASNAGLEGLCYAGGVLLAASESSGTLADGRRFAPLGRHAFGRQDAAELQLGGDFVPLRLALSSATGNISALSCRVAQRPCDGAPLGDVLEVLAIERHYGTSRILAFRLPLQAAAGTILLPRLALNLAPLVVPLRNYEGIAWLPNGDVLLVTDNNVGFSTGPTEALLVPNSLLKEAFACP